MLRILITLSALLGIFSCCISMLYALPKYDPIIPNGYVGETALKVSYGKSFGEVGVSWGSDGSEREYCRPASVGQMKVVGDRFYFYDSTDAKIKLFRSPGQCIWESSEVVDAMQYTVSPDGFVYVVGGGSQDLLSCIDNSGKMLWKRKVSDIWPKDEYQNYNFREIIWWVDIEWTWYGLTATMCVSPQDGGQAYYLFALDSDGKVNQLLSREDRFVGPDGTLYKTENWRSNQPQKMAIQRDKAGKKVREISFEFDADSGKHLAGKEMTMSKLKPAASGDYEVEGNAVLDQVYSSNNVVTGKLEEVLWRFDSQGKFKEQWRFLVSPFRHVGPEIVVGSTGDIYHLQFDVGGIEVVRYSRACP